MASVDHESQSEAGPSTPSRPRPPSISQSPANETSAIAESLKSRRLRRGSLRAVFSGKKVRAKIDKGDEPDGKGSDAEEDEDESVLRAVVEEGERMKAERLEAVEVLKKGKKFDVEEGDVRGGDGEPRQEYVWDGEFLTVAECFDLLITSLQYSSRTKEGELDLPSCRLGSS